ncbi:MAG: hypothetical protein ACR2RE_14265, partial [Geminicoccaceae bacterium]
LREMAKTNRQAQWTGAFQELAAKRRETDARADELAKTQRTAAEVNKALLGEIEKDLLGDARELDKLAAERSPLYGIRRQAFDAKQARLGEIVRLVEAHQEDADTRSEEAQDAKRGNELSLLYMHHPELKADEEVANKALGDVGLLMHELGWTKEEIQGTVDHRLIRLALMAAGSSTKEDRAKAVLAKKLSKPAGKTAIKPGRRRTKADSSKARQANARNKLSRSGSDDDFVALLEEKGIG